MGGGANAWTFPFGKFQMKIVKFYESMKSRLIEICRCKFTYLEKSIKVKMKQAKGKRLIMKKTILRE